MRRFAPALIAALFGAGLACSAPSSAAPLFPVQAAASPRAAANLPPIQYDLATLPDPVRKLREQLIAAAKSGDIEKLRPVIQAMPEQPTFTDDDVDDPITFLKGQSGDGLGREILGILLDVLDAGWVHVDVGTDHEMYVWPYFARYPVEGLTGPQLVELFRLITAGDFQDMQSYGAYVFYRIGIAPDGTWKYFVAGQ